MHDDSRSPAINTHMCVMTHTTPHSTRTHAWEVGLITLMCMMTMEPAPAPAEEKYHGQRASQCPSQQRNHADAMRVTKKEYRSPAAGAAVGAEAPLPRPLRRETRRRVAVEAVRGELHRRPGYQGGRGQQGRGGGEEQCSLLGYRTHEVPIQGVWK